MDGNKINSKANRIQVCDITWVRRKRCTSAESDHRNNQDGKCLHCPIYNFWLQAVIFDDACIIEETLNKDSVDKDKLLNGSFIYDGLDVNVKVTSKYGDFHVRTPWCLAGVCRAHGVMSSLLCHGVDVLATDIHNNNIIHCLIYMAFFENNEDSYVETLNILLKLLEEDHQGSASIKDLMLSSNSEDLRPLELAAHLGCCRLFTILMDVPGIYLRKCQPNGMYTLLWYDITDFEIQSATYRGLQSPMQAIVYLDKKCLEHSATKDLFQSEVFQTWFYAKKASMRPFMILWLTMRVCYMTMFWILDIGGRNTPNMSQMNRSTNSSSLGSATLMLNTCSTPLVADNTDAILLYLFCHSICIILFDIFEAITTRLKSQTQKIHKKPKNLVLYYRFYRVTQTLLAVTVTLLSLSYFLKRYYNSEGIIIFQNIIYIQASSSLIWSLLYFIQLVPWIGHFVVSVQRMIKDLLQFCVLLFLCITPYAFAFRKFLRGDSTGACVNEFDSIWRSYYTSFTIMLNMVSFNSYTVNVNKDTEWTIYILHMVFVFIIPILLINLLIAIYSNSYAEIAQYKDIIMMIQRLSMFTILESRVMVFLPGIAISSSEVKPPLVPQRFNPPLVPQRFNPPLVPQRFKPPLTPQRLLPSYQDSPFSLEYTKPLCTVYVSQHACPILVKNP